MPTDVKLCLVRYIDAGMDLLGGAGGVHPLALARGGGGVIFFMIKQKKY
jgi:hypothetical protein